MAMSGRLFGLYIVKILFLYQTKALKYQCISFFFAYFAN